MLSKNRQKFAKSPNQNICNQTLSTFARFPESGDKFANMATLIGSPSTWSPSVLFQPDRYDGRKKREENVEKNAEKNKEKSNAEERGRRRMRKERKREECGGVSWGKLCWLQQNSFYTPGTLVKTGNNWLAIINNSLHFIRKKQLFHFMYLKIRNILFLLAVA